MQIPDCDHVTRLILLQQLHRLGLVDYSPLDDPEFVMALGGEGVEPAGSGDPPTGPVPPKNFSATTDTKNTDKHTKNIDKIPEQYQVTKGLTETGDPWGTAIRWRAVWEGYNPMGCELLKKLKELEIYRIEVRVLDRFERAVLRKVAHVMEVDRVARNKFKREWIKEKRRKRRNRRAVWSYEIRKKERERVIAEYEAMKKKAEVQPSAVHEEVPAIDGDPPSGKNDEGKRGESLPASEKSIGWDWRENYVKGADITEEQKAATRPEPRSMDLGEVVKPLGPADDILGEMLEEKHPVERSFEGVGEVPVVEMEVVRVGPNPRVLLCRYRLGDAVEAVNVWVKTNKNYTRSMRFKMTYQEGKDWQYDGVQPRRLGRW